MLFVDNPTAPSSQLDEWASGEDEHTEIQPKRIHLFKLKSLLREVFFSFFKNHNTTALPHLLSG